MRPDAYKTLYDVEESHWWFRSRRTLFSGQLARAANELHKEAPLELLDYGCGSGHNLQYLNSWGHVIGAEISDICLRDRRKAPEFKCLDARHDLSEHRGRYDVVTALDVLEHMDDDVEGLKNLAEFIHDDGQIVVTVPSYQWLWSDQDVLSHHKRRYTTRQLREVAEKAGLDILFLSYFNALILPMAATIIWAKRLFKRNSKLISNFSLSPSHLNDFLFRLTSIENMRVGMEKLRLPLGLSIVGRFRKKK